MLICNTDLLDVRYMSCGYLESYNTQTVSLKTSIIMNPIRMRTIEKEQRKSRQKEEWVAVRVK